MQFAVSMKKSWRGMQESCCHAGQVSPLSVGILTCEMEQALNLQPASFTRFSGFAAQQRKGSEGKGGFRLEARRGREILMFGALWIWLEVWACLYQAFLFSSNSLFHSCPVLGLQCQCVTARLRISHQAVFEGSFVYNKKSKYR